MTNHDDPIGTYRVGRYEGYIDVDPEHKEPTVFVLIIDKVFRKKVCIRYSAFRKHVSEAKKQLKFEEERK